MKKDLFFKESVNFLSEENIKFIEEIILSFRFPYYLELTKRKTDTKYLFFSHVVQERLEDNVPNASIKTEPMVYENTKDILFNFLNSINEPINFFIRINYNFCFNNGSERSEIHVDHHFKHKQIVIYLNDADTFSRTCIVNDKKEIIKEVAPKKFKGICFDSSEHFIFFPKNGYRLTLVATYI